MAQVRATLKHAWNVFTNQEDRLKAQPRNSPWPVQPDTGSPRYYGGGYAGARPDRMCIFSHQLMSNCNILALYINVTLHIQNLQMINRTIIL